MSANGQLSATSTVLEASSPAPHPVAVCCYNTDPSNNQTVSLQLTPSGTTALTLCQIVLGPAETLILSGVYLAANDTVSGYATSAGQVNYFIQNLAINWSGSMEMRAYDRTGRLKTNDATAAGIGVSSNNWTATNDPGAANDQNQGYGVGSFWVNVVSNRVWINVVSTPGAAVWVWANPNLGAVSTSTGALASTTFLQGTLTGGLETYYTNTAATPGILTTRTAALMFTDQAGAQVGASYKLRIGNASQNGTIGLAGGTGVSITGSPYVLPNTWNDYVATFVSTTAMTLTYVGSGPFVTDLIQGFSQFRITPKGL